MLKRGLLLVIVLLGLSGCSTLDSVLGVDDPEREAQVKSTIESLDEALPPPWGWIAGGVGGAAVTTYVGIRRKQKEGEATA